MVGLASYPRTGGDASAAPPLAAYANVPEPLRSRLIAQMQAYFEGFAKENPSLSFLLPSYLDPNHFRGFFREDNLGRLFPEPGAIAGDVPVYGQTLANDIDLDDLEAAWSNPQIRDILKTTLKAFQGQVVKAESMSDNELIWRFVGANYHLLEGGQTTAAWFCNRIDGEWWGVGPIPLTEMEWRSLYSIPGIWNGDGGYVCHRLGDLPPDVQATFRSGLVGSVGPQPSMVPEHYFPGGGRQLYVPHKQMERHRAVLNRPELVKPSAWNVNG